MQLEFKKFIAKTTKGANLDARALRVTSKSEFASVDTDNSRFGWPVRLYILSIYHDERKVTHPHFHCSRVEFQEFFAYFKANYEGAIYAAIVATFAHAYTFLESQSPLPPSMLRRIDSSHSPK